MSEEQSLLTEGLGMGGGDGFLEDRTLVLRHGTSEPAEGGKGNPQRALHGKSLEIGKCVCSLLPKLLLPYHVASLTSRNITDHLPDLLSSHQGPNPRLSVPLEVSPTSLKRIEAGAKRDTLWPWIYTLSSLSQLCHQQPREEVLVTWERPCPLSVVVSLGQRSREPTLIVGLEGVMWEEGSRIRDGIFPIGHHTQEIMIKNPDGHV